MIALLDEVMQADTAGDPTNDQNYALRVNCKSIAQTQHPERNRKFELIEDFRKQFEGAGAPILSLDTKKKELIGNFRNQGQAWSGPATRSDLWSS